MSAQPIGIFDSGLGGLTVLKAVHRALPNENIIYLGDTARLPYGSKSTQTIKRYVTQNLEFFLKQDVKAVVVACNSASAALRESPLSFPKPLFEVILPGSMEAAKASQSKRIGVVGTWATVSNKAYEKCLKDLDPELKIFSQACPLLVPLVEEGWIDDPLTNLIIHRYIGPLLGQAIDTLILGCTHYPALATAIRKVIGPNIAMTDSGEAVAAQLKAAFSRGDILKNAIGPGSLKLMTTDRGARLQQIAETLLSLGRLPEIEVVDVV